MCETTWTASEFSIVSICPRPMDAAIAPERNHRRSCWLEYLLHCFRISEELSARTHFFSHQSSFLWARPFAVVVQLRMLQQSEKKGQQHLLTSSKNPSKSMKPGGIFQFGNGFRVDASTRTLRSEDEVVTLNRRAFDVLLYLLQNPGRVITRNELLRNVWPDTVVEESSLVQSIYVLRRALSERPGDNKYIVTLAGRGYQFVSPVKVTASDSLQCDPGRGGR